MNTPLRDLAAAALLVLAAAVPALLPAAHAEMQAEAHGQRQPAPAALSPGELRTLLATMPAGEPARGERLHAEQFCASCHGAKGVAPTPNWPHVAGQRAAYTFKMLVDYQRGIRAEVERAALMHAVTRDMAAQDMADLAAWYATLPLPHEAETPRPKTTVAAAAVQRLVRKGDPSRLITPCASCHGARGQGGTGDGKASPALAGQNPRYLVRTLQQYHGDVRTNDPKRGMRAFAQRLSSAEVDALASYYADLTAAR
ncbi:c-type cytochrome [Rubrivivax albus]|uniref:C-type cytochrome n=1 Tax=Rubrivivax albus TaxID=2499835 RepID=A0A437JX63_9BURK|nr:c-type cytochrome [Rubrivivax albus]RVT52256.1 c-type cytochrome [Rubrivivax albus]